MAIIGTLWLHLYDAAYMIPRDLLSSCMHAQIFGVADRVHSIVKTSYTLTHAHTH